jgi:hypothetical protein
MKGAGRAEGLKNRSDELPLLSLFEQQNGMYFGLVSL